MQQNMVRILLKACLNKIKGVKLETRKFKRVFFVSLALFLKFSLSTILFLHERKLSFQMPS